MSERPIIFNGEMVRAILDGRKTMTRRVVKNASVIIQDWDKNDKSYGPFFEDEYGDSHKTVERCPYGQPGDRLWVRETFSLRDDGLVFSYRSDYPKKGFWEDAPHYGKDIKWKPSIHMPRWASRITLEITDIRVERLQEITQWDCEAEGIIGTTSPSPVNGLPYETYSAAGFKESEPKLAFERLWDSAAKPGFTWDDNPWVWVVEFKQLGGGKA